MKTIFETFGGTYRQADDDLFTDLNLWFEIKSVIDSINANAVAM